MTVMDTPRDDFDSTLIRHGNEAATFHEMVEFAELLEERPISKLLEELPSLARLSTAKFNLTMQVLRRRFRGEVEADRETLRAFALEIASAVEDEQVRLRIQQLFA
jgi:hypothetical protein